MSEHVRPENGASPGPVPLLEMRNIAKTFPGVQALSGVSFAAYPGEIHALMGENGAGKSTLMKVLSGAHRADPGGEIRLNGERLNVNTPEDARAAGIAIIYQELALAPNLTVAENMYLGREDARAGLLDRRTMERECAAVLQRLSTPIQPSTRVSELSTAEQQLVEIARALMSNARILVMDEPTTSLSQRETERLFTLVRHLRDEGLAIVYISHRMSEVYELADRVSVLRDGSLVGTLTAGELDADTLVQMMVGRDLSSFYKKEHGSRRAADVVLSVRDMADDKRVHGCSFDLYEGEVLGLAGLVGAGRTELARLIYGADRRERGEVRLGQLPVTINRPEDAMKAGIVYLTEDRKRLGLFLDMSVRDNVNISVLGQDAYRGGLLNFRAARRRAREAVEKLGIRVSSAAVNVGSLSGGNQQKVLLSRLLETHPRVLILDEPTRGVDVGAKSEIYRLIDQLAQTGVGIIVISSELPEIIGIADRAIVMRDGELVGEIHATDPEFDQDTIIGMATGAEGATHPGPATAGT